MVGEEHHDGLVGAAAAVEGIEHLAELGVHVRHGREVAMPHLGGRGGRERTLLRRRAEHLAAVVEGDLRRPVGPAGIERRQPVTVVEIPVPLGCRERRVRLPEADGQKKRPVGRGQFREHPHRIGGDAAVVVGLVGHVATLDERHAAVVSRAVGGEVGRQRAGDLRDVIAVRGEVEKLRGRPGAGVAVNRGVPVVEDLAGAAGLVAVLLEPEGNRGHVGIGLAEVHRVAPDAERVGPPAGEERRPRRIADRLLAVGPVELHAAGREPLEVRRDGHRAVAGDLGPQVVGHDEEHVGAGLGRERHKHDDQANEHVEAAIPHESDLPGESCW